MSGGGTNDTALRIVDNAAVSRYEALLGKELVGFSEYRALRDRRVFVHTEVDERYEGLGYGRLLIKAALDDARTRGLKVTPICPFMAAYIKRHPEYDDLVSWGRRPPGAKARGG